MSSPSKFFIYGAPGAGKTTLSVELQKKLSCPLVEADYLREAVAQKEKTQTEDPFVYVGTTEAFRKFGPLTKENVIRGLGAVRNSMAPYVAREISKHLENLILEAAFLDPHELRGSGKLILVVTSDEERHRRQYFEHRKNNRNQSEAFRAARIIQDYFLEEAKRLSVMVVENEGELNMLARKVSFGNIAGN